MPFKKNGFLGRDGQKLVADHRKRFASWFVEAEKLNRVCHKLLSALALDGNNLQTLTCASLYLRALGSYSACVKLLELGMSLDAGSVLRSQVESLILLTACAKDEKFVGTYHKSQEAFRLKLINLALKGEDGTVKCDASTKPKLLKMKAEIEASKPAHLDIASVATKHGLQGIYNSAYRLLSNNNIHSSSKSLEQFFVIGEDHRSVKAIIWGPSTKEIPTHLTLAIACMIAAFHELSMVFSVPQNKVKPLRQRAAAVKKGIDKLNKAQN